MSDADLIEQARERFVSETSDHVMEVVLDEGLHRHLRCRKPGTVMYGFEIVTWPGYLAVAGDCGDFVFARVPDMFEFFVPRTQLRGGFDDVRWGINPQYWSEKLQAPSPDAALRYSYETFQARVLGWFNEVAEEMEADAAAALRAALNEEVLAGQLGAAHSEHEAYRLLQDFEHDGRRIYDSFEWRLREYDWSFLWCCWAIVWGIGQYNAARKPAADPVPA